MTVSPQQAVKLLTGNQIFSQLGFTMLLTRLKGVYAKDPASLQSCTAEINAFLAKFHSIMGKDIELIAKI